MPKAKTRSTTPRPVAPTPTLPTSSPAPEVQSTVMQAPALEVVYDKIGLLEYSVSSERGPLTPQDMKDLMSWETEADYQKRMVAENPGSVAEHHLYGEVYHCLDTKKRKVRCLNNANNRFFDSGWCDDLRHTILEGQWAGPLMMPGETINGETIRISRYGRVLSGQHCMTACILADELLQESRSKKDNAADPRYPAWNGHKECVLETIVVTGLSEDERVLRTIDYVKPRTVADMLFTMDLFRSNSPVERREMTRMLSGAIDTLWNRTNTQGYKTHPEVVGFLERHKRLLKCVEHLFLLNKKDPSGGRRISLLRLSPGMCSALMFIQGSSGPRTDGDFYRNESPPSEKCLDWSLWDRAKDFWTRLAKDESFMLVRKVLGRLKDSSVEDEGNLGLGGRLQEKIAILANAWERWKDHLLEYGDPFESRDEEEDGIFYLTYTNVDEDGNKLPDDMVNLVDIADFYGIDWPTVPGAKKTSSRFATPMPPPPTEDEIEDTKDAIHSEKRAEFTREEVEAATAAAHARRAARG